jgi:hypothetical protein
MTWYNSWLNKLILSGNTQDQLEIAERIRSLEKDFQNAQVQHALELDQLKQNYDLLISEYEVEGSLSEEHKATVQRVGQVVNQSSQGNLHLPDYTSFLNENYASATLRRVVLEDLSVLLTTKLHNIDSLIERDREQVELADRLSAFHDDLGLQMEAGQDIQARNAQGVLAQNNSWEHSSEISYDAGVGSEASIRTSVAGDALIIRVDRDPVASSTSGSIPLDTRDQLELKRSEYRALLEKISLELQSSE